MGADEEEKNFQEKKDKEKEANETHQQLELGSFHLRC